MKISIFPIWLESEGNITITSYEALLSGIEIVKGCGITLFKIIGISDLIIMQVKEELPCF